MSTTQPKKVKKRIAPVLLSSTTPMTTTTTSNTSTGTVKKRINPTLLSSSSDFSLPTNESLSKATPTLPTGTESAKEPATTNKTVAKKRATPEEPKTVPEKPIKALVIIRNLKAADLRGELEPTEIIDFSTGDDKDDTDFLPRDNAMEEEDDEEDDAEGNEDLFDPLASVYHKGSSRLIANLERFYVNGYVDGYDFGDDFIDDDVVTIRASETLALAEAPTEYEGFYIHQGKIRYRSQPDQESAEPPTKKQKVQK